MDGVDACTKLSQGEFDIVVTDVEMPRMDGFALTEKIRADKRYGEILYPCCAYERERITAVSWFRTTKTA